VSLFIDTSVFSLAWRRDRVPDIPEVVRFAQALDSGEEIFTTGVVLQELLQGFAGAKAKAAITSRFEAIGLIVPTRADHVAAATLRNQCQRSGIQIGTIDALLAQLCISRALLILSADRDFVKIAEQSSLRVWK